MNRAALYALAFLALGLIALPSLSASAAPTQIVSPAGPAIQLDVGKGRLVRLAQPAASVFIADPDIADVQVKSSTLVYVFGKSSGVTTLYAVGEHDDVLLNAELTVRFDVARVQQAIRDLIPHSGVTVSAADDSIVLGGTVYSAADGDSIRKIAARFVSDPKQIVNDMKVEAPNQINLRVRVAEVSRNILKELGINWNAAFNAGSHFGVGGISLFTGLAQGTPAPTIFNLHYSSGPNHTVDLNPVIDALDQHGLISVLAEPNLTAVSGEPASFLAGGEFPVPVPQTGTGGVPTVTIMFKQFGVSLNFVATIAGSDRINLHVNPEVSQLSTQGAITIDGIQIPALTTRRAETTVDLGSGQSFAIAGLLQNEITQSINKFPGLGDVPVLGALFRSQSFQRGESELVIIVTPYIVHPIATASRAKSPTDGYVPSSDLELIGNGNEYRKTGRGQGGPVARNGTPLVGPVGFDLE